MDNNQTEVQLNESKIERNNKKEGINNEENDLSEDSLNTKMKNANLNDLSNKDKRSEHIMK